MKRLTVQIEDDLYTALLDRANGPRKISPVMNQLLRLGLAHETEAEIAALEQRLTQLRAARQAPQSGE